MDYRGFLTDKRIERLKGVVQKRQFDCTIVLENIHDPHNIAAVVRSCDAVGVAEIYVLLTDDRIDPLKYEWDHNDVSSGSKKWMQVHLFHDVDEMMKSLRQKYDKVLGTHLSQDAIRLYDIDFNAHATALVFGNEHEGISEELLSHLDGNFLIPQYGMVQSLNISVACAVSVFEASRQKALQGKYQLTNWEQAHQDLFDLFAKRSKPRLTEEVELKKNIKTEEL